MNKLPRILPLAGIGLVFLLGLSACGGGGGSSNAATVTPIIYGSTVLTWTAPTTRVDGTALASSDIAGYRIFYGQTQGVISGEIDDTNGSIPSYSVTLPIGTYYFEVAVIDTNGVQGNISMSITKTITQ